MCINVYAQKISMCINVYAQKISMCMHKKISMCINVYQCVSMCINVYAQKISMCINVYQCMHKEYHSVSMLYQTFLNILNKSQ